MQQEKEKALEAIRNLACRSARLAMHSRLNVFPYAPRIGATGFGGGRHSGHSISMICKMNSRIFFCIPKEISQTYTRVLFKVSEWRQGKELPKVQGLILGSTGKKGKVTALIDKDDIHCLMIGANRAYDNPVLDNRHAIRSIRAGVSGRYPVIPPVEQSVL